MKVNKLIKEIQSQAEINHELQITIFTCNEFRSRGFDLFVKYRKHIENYTGYYLSEGVNRQLIRNVMYSELTTAEQNQALFMRLFLLESFKDEVNNG